MNICIVTPTFYPVKGGTETIINEIGSHLVKLGHEVQLITRKLSNMSETEVLNGIKIDRIYTFNNPLGILPMQIILYKKLKNMAKDCDLIHQFHVFHMGLATIQVKKKYKKTFVLSLMGDDTYDPIHPIPKFFNPYMAYVMNQADIITSPSRDLEKHAIKQGLKKDSLIIPHGIDVGKYKLNNGKEIREKLQMTDDDVLILSVQRLYPRKKLQVLIKAARIIIKKNKNTKFVIVGKGPEQNSLIELVNSLKIQNNVIFTGFVPDDDLPNYYSACDVFVLHSTYEAFGIVMAEAMASAKPVVSTTVGAIPEVVDHEKTGLLVPPLNEDAMAKSILKLVEDKDLRIKMGISGRKKAENKYNWNDIVQKYIDIYENLVG